jgi:SAM-dependent methyltransferase
LSGEYFIAIILSVLGEMVRYKDSFNILSENAYYDFAVNQYEPSLYESDELNDDRFYKGTYYSHVCWKRCFLVYREIARHLSIGSKIIDIGFFPGTLVRQLKELFNGKISCYGIGNKVDKEFIKFMQTYVEQCESIELDPFYLKQYRQIEVPFENDAFDAVIATEIFEHLISPLEMIEEGARILKKGGLFIITTPNVSHIGAVLKLLIGRSNYERLDRSPMYLQNDPWRGHIRFYDKKELTILFRRNDLKLIKHRYYLEKGWAYAKWPFLKRIIINLINKCAPLYREGHFAVFQKQ